MGAEMRLWRPFCLGDYMAQYDGSIRIGTKIDTKEASSQLMALENRMVKTADKIAGLRSKLESLKNVKIPTEEFTAVQAQIDATEKKINDLAARQEKFLATGGSQSSSAYQKMQYDLDELRNSLPYLKSEMQDLIDTGRAFTFGDPSKIAQTEQQLKYAENDLSVLKQKQAELQEKNAETQSSYVRLGESVRNAFKTIGRGLIDIPIAAIKKGVDSLKSAFTGIANIGKKAFSGMISGLKNLTSHLKKAVTSMLRFGKSTKSASGFLQGGLKNILRYGLGVRSLYALINKLRSAIKDGFTNLYNDSSMTAFKSSVDSLKASLLTLKNAIAGAFAPIVQTAIPYIQRLVEWITKAVDAVGQLMAALMGRKTYTRAIKQSAKASEEVAEATEDETDAMNKQLSPLDKLNVLTTEKNKKNKDSGADDGVSAPMFEEVPISDKFKDIAKWLKDMWDKADFFELGKLLGDKLAKALANIPWDKIKENAAKLGKSLATLINGFIKGEFDGISVGWWIGHTLAEGINTGFEFLNAFVHNLDWAGVGQFIAETINGFFQSIDWDLIYDTFVTTAAGLASLINNFAETLDWDAIATAVSNFFNTLIDTIYTFVTETDWIALAQKVGQTISDAFTGIDWAKAGETVGEVFKAFFNFISTTIENIDWWAVGEKVKEFLVNIDWNGVFDALCEAIGAAFGGLMAFLGGLLANAVADAVDYFRDKIEEAGGNVVEGILVGIAEALAGIGEWIKEHIFQPFVDGFKKAFDIHSPSGVTEGFGKNIIDGLLVGFKDAWKNITSWISDKINWLKEKFSSMGSTIKGVFGGSGGSSSTRSTTYSTRSISPPYAANSAFANVADAPIPALARGAVIPPNRAFLAVLGDQRSGTNVEAPLETIKQAQTEALVEAFTKLGLTGGNTGGGSNTYEFSIDGRIFFQIMQKYAEEYKKQSGGRLAFS
ncbi:MAG: hypothetical protein NC430_12250 [bacterium]|nr:hypothetical protein [bacterium]MCM1424834.1 hypothetical protein [bacterium]